MTARDAIIRPFGRADVPAMQEVRAAAFAPVFRSFAEILGERIYAIAFAQADADQARLIEALCEPGSGQEALVAEVGGAIVGFAAYSMNARRGTGEIGLNAVHPDHAGRGLGTRMYEQVLARMKASGVKLASVSTGGDPSHAPARRAYAKAGFAKGAPSITLYRLI